MSQNIIAQDKEMKKKEDKMKMEDSKMKDSKMKMGMDDLKSWPMASQMAAKDMMDKYGKPDEMTPTMIVWNSKGPWAKTVVFSKENFSILPLFRLNFYPMQ
jgi:hypothetical protein